MLPTIDVLDDQHMPSLDVLDNDKKIDETEINGVFTIEV